MPDMQQVLNKWWVSKNLSSALQCLQDQIHTSPGPLGSTKRGPNHAHFSNSPCLAFRHAAFKRAIPTTAGGCGGDSIKTHIGKKSSAETDIYEGAGIQASKDSRQQLCGRKTGLGTAFSSFYLIVCPSRSQPSSRNQRC